ncbi:hypothetical protein [Chelativorans alearense]|uniref:hypothetical protein n=1 Tax=Chelativorans alearense TaxID=2681495 RepID=UPI0013D6FE7D|nr:hypothetical protein [Chelativorans alearense]
MSNDIQPPPIRNDGLQLAEDRSFQNRHWTIQRLAWIGFGLLLLVALAGFSGGGGYFSKQTLQLGDATVVLPRVSRWQDSDSISLAVRDTSTVTVVFGPTFHNLFTIEQIQPQPDHSEATTLGLLLRFSLTGSGTKRIDLDVKMLRPGWASFDVSIGSASETAWTVVLP